MKKFTLTIIAFYLTASFMAQSFFPMNGMGTKQLDDDENTVVPPIANKGASKDLLDLLIYQPMFDGTGSTAQNSTLDTSNGIDYETADNFWEIEENVEKMVFYGLTMNHIGGVWVEQIPDETEPLFIRFYNFESSFAGLVAPQTGTYKLALLDSFGDGWNNGMTTVSINGTPVLSNITLPNGYDTAYHEFSVNQDDLISSTYTNGSWSYENYYAILDPSDNIIAEQGGTWDTPWTSTPISIGKEEPIVLEPNWANPISSHSLNAAVKLADDLNDLSNNRIEGDDCSNAIDLGSISSPYSGSTIDANNDFSFCSMGSSNDLIFFRDIEPGYGITIWQSWNNFDSRHTMRWGGTCPGENEVACIDEPDNKPITWANYTGETQRVWFILAGFSSSQGDFTLNWEEFFCGQVEIPFSENFDSSNSLPECWIFTGSGSIFSYSIFGPAYSNPNSFRFYQSYSSALLSTPSISNSLSTVLLKFQTMLWLGTHTQLIIGTLSEDGDKDTFTAHQTINLDNNWQEHYVSFETETGSDSRIAFVYGNNTDTWGSACLDDVLLTEKPTCIEPYGISATNVGFNGADLEWMQAGSASSYNMEFGISGFEPGTGTFVSGIPSSPYPISGLEQGTQYDVYLQANCGAKDLSTWKGPFTFKTLVLGDNCSVAIDLSQEATPYSGSTSLGSNFFNFCSMGDSNDLIFFHDVENGHGITIWQSWNNYDSRHTMRWGGECPGLYEVDCIDDPDNKPITWANNTGETQRVWFILAGFLNSQGSFTLDWDYFECEPSAIPYSEYFDSNQIPLCWSQEYSGTMTTSPWMVSNTSNAGGTAYEMRANGIWGTGVSRLVSPPLNFTGTHYPTIEFRHSFSGNSPGADFKIQSSTDGTYWVDEALLFSSDGGNLTPSIVNVQISNTSESTFIAWVIEGNHNTFNNWSVDNVKVEDLGTCPKPYSLDASNITQNSATLSWVQLGSPDTWNIQWGLEGFEEGTGFLVENTQSNPYLIQGLTPNTSYDFYVQTICNEKETSNWAGPYPFKTECELFNLPYAETFDLPVFPDCWSQTFSGGITSNRWAVSYTSSAGGSLNEMRARWGSGVGTSRLIAPAINLTEAESPMLEFKHYFSDYGSGLTFKIQSSPDGINWVDEDFSFTSGGGNIGPIMVTVPITTISETTYIAWVIDGNHFYFNNWYVDDVFIDDGVCPRPYNIEAGNITTTSADLSWSQWGEIDYWNLEWGPSGFEQGSGNMITNIEGKPVHLGSLTLGTAYDFYVQTVCLSSETSEWVGPNSFSTLAEGDNCSNAFDLSSMVSPYSGTITTANNHFNFCYMGSYKDLIFFHDVEPNHGIRIWQSWNNFTSRHTMRWGGDCPGENEIDCIYSPKTAPISWVNLTGETERVWFILAGLGSGDFTLEWEYYSCAPNDIPFAESFESGFFPNCWIQTISAGISSYRWFLTNSSYAGGTPYEMMASRSTGTGVSRLILPAIDLSSVANPFIEFNHYFLDVNPGCTFKIQSSTDGLNWTDEAFSFESGTGNIGPEFISLPLTTKSEATYISFTIDGNHIMFFNWFVDDITVYDGNCPRPSRLSTTNITPSSADLAWEQWGLVNSWNVQWGAEGFELGNGTVENNINDPYYTASGLSYSTSYEFYVQANCDNGDSSNWSGPHNFETGNPLSVSISASPTAICLGEQTQLSVAATHGYGNYSYSWTSDPPGFLSDIANPIAAPTENTIFQVVVSDNEFVITESVAVEVYTDPPTSPGNLLPGNGTIVPNRSVTFSWQPSANAAYYNLFLWSDGEAEPQNPTVENITAIQHTYRWLSYATTYSWKVVAINPCDGISSETMTFSVAELPDLVVSNILVPENPFSGQQVEISWTVFNQGNDGTHDKFWLDFVYLSEDTTIDATDTYLGGFQNLTTLPENTGYTNSKTFTIPNGYFGTKYFIVKTDAYNNVIEEDENNNVSFAPIEINLTPPPDLFVTNIIVPTVAFSGQNITVNWTTTNQGTGGIHNQNWIDHIYLSLDEEYDAASSIFLGQQSFNQSLAPGESYNGSRNVTLPANVFGDYYIYVITDFFDNVYEHANSDNNISRSSVMEILLTPPPDLTVLNIQHPATASNSEQITISYLNHNMGGSETLNSWLDQIWLCPEPVFDENNSIDIGLYWRTFTLHPGQSMQANYNATIPASIYGSYYVFVNTDFDERVFEHTNTDNNLVRSTNPMQVNYADLAIASFNAPSSASSGEAINVSWSLLNDGGGSVINKTIVDKVFLSSSEDFAKDTPVEIGTITYTANLNPGQNIAKTHSVTIPDGVSGQHYLFVFTNTTNTVYENDLTDNNSASTPVTIILSPYPDLEVESFSVPASFNLGYQINVDYTVTNSGTLAIDGKTWKDALFASTSQVFDISNSVKLQESIEGPDLPLGEPYSRTLEMAVPVKDYMNYSNIFLHLVSDFENKIFEMDKENNIASSSSIPVSIPPQIDLEATTASTPVTSTKSGSTVNFIYTVTNISTPTHVWDVSQWNDAIYLSANSIWDPEDILVTDWLVIDALETDEAYTVSGSLVVPKGIHGNYFFIMVADHENLVDDSNLANNAISISGEDPIFVEQTFYPDLTVDMFESPFTATAGQPIKFKWEVSNIGEGPTTSSSWTDRVYLSTDYNIDNNDVQLSNKTISRTLEVGQNYTDSIEVLLPANLSGNFILIFRTDANNNVFETGQGKANNVAFVGINIVQALPCDLVVEDIWFASPQQTGSTTRIDYTIKNIGTNPAQGYIRDIVYFSNDTILDINDKVFSQKGNSINLAPQMTVNLFMDAMVPGMLPDDYHVLVKTNVFNNINELNFDNNTGTSTNTMEVGMPQLVFDEPETTQIDFNVPKYYQLEVPLELEGETLSLTLDSQHQNKVTEIYLSHESIPTRSNHHYSATTPFSANQELLVPVLQQGNYYLMVFENTSWGSSQSVELLATILPFEVRSINASQGGNTGSITVIVTGAKFETHMTLTLANDSGEQYTADETVFINSTKVYATFNLLEAEPGWYDVVARKLNPGIIDQEKNDSEVAVLEEGFEIVETTLPELSINILPPSSIRPGWISSVTVDFINNGNVDMVNKTITILSQTSSPVAFSVTGLQEMETEISLLLQEPDAPPGILRPGYQGQFTFFIKSTSGLGFIIEY